MERPSHGRSQSDLMPRSNIERSGAVRGRAAHWSGAVGDRRTTTQGVRVLVFACTTWMHSVVGPRTPC
jgi:hypothetical protein